VYRASLISVSFLCSVSVRPMAFCVPLLAGAFCFSPG
jgi:hypothetical protein